MGTAEDKTNELLAAWRSLDRMRPHRGTSDTERAILAATEALLRETSLQDISVEQILSGSGVSRRTFYVYFSSKQSVVAALLVAAMQEIFTVLQDSMAGAAEEDPAVVLGRTLDTTAVLWIEKGPIMSAVLENLRQIPEFKELWLQILGQFADTFASYIDEARRAGRLPPGPASRQLASVLVWSTERCFYIAGLGIDPRLPSERDVMLSVLTLWLGALGAPPENPDPDV